MKLRPHPWANYMEGSFHTVQPWSGPYILRMPNVQKTEDAGRPSSSPARRGTERLLGLPTARRDQEFKMRMQLPKHAHGMSYRAFDLQGWAGVVVVDHTPFPW